jgi:DNA (cytosine-5)-methyltransferase 1
MESQRPSKLWQDLSDQGKWDAMYGDRDNKEEPHDCDTVNHLSLCSGIGGIDLGLRAVVEGCRSVAYVEIEAFAVAHLVAQMEAGGLDSAPVFTDLHDFPWQDFAGVVDIISGGFPCQPFSHAGNQAGVEDPRHLWPTIAKGIGIVRPGCVFFENVDGIASAKSPGYHSVLHHVISDLEGMGYKATAGCFTASEVGAPHLRKRWFILGLADADRDTRRQGEPRRAGRELSTEGEGLRGGQVKGKAGQESWRSGELADSISKGLEGHAWNEHNEEGPTGRRAISGSTPPCRIQRGNWRRVLFASECKGFPDEAWCPCGLDYCECGCPGPTEDGWQYIEDGYQMWAKREQHWPARPREHQHNWEPPRVTQSSVGRDADGLPFRVDRLRALGNAVVPAVAARAFATLWRELT